MSDQKDPRALIAEGRRHDEAMTRSPWRWGDWGATFGTAEDPQNRFCLEHNPTNPGPDLCVRGRDDGSRGVLRIESDAWEREADLQGIVWMRNNLRALLDGYASALIERDEAKAWIARTTPEYEATIQARRRAELEVADLIKQRDEARAQVAALRSGLDEIERAAGSLNGWSHDLMIEAIDMARSR